MEAGVNIIIFIFPLSCREALLQRQQWIKMFSICIIYCLQLLFLCDFSIQTIKMWLQLSTCVPSIQKGWSTYSQCAVFSSHIKSFMVFIIIEYYIQMIFCVNYIFLMIYLLKQSKYDFNLAPMFLQYNIDEVHILIVQLVFCILNHI